MARGHWKDSPLPCSPPASWLCCCPLTKAPGASVERPPLQRGIRRCCPAPRGTLLLPGCVIPGVANKGVPFPSPAREINLDWILFCEGCPPPLCHYHNEMEVARGFNNISQESVSAWLRRARDGERGGGRGQGLGCSLQGAREACPAESRQADGHTHSKSPGGPLAWMRPERSSEVRAETC